MIGIDIVVISRIEKLIKRFGDKALKKYLSDDEILLVKNSSTASGFWAVKEATSKALGVGIGKKCSFYDIKIEKTKKNAPIVKLSKKVRKRFKIRKKIAVSITHDGGFAIAVVVLKKIKKVKK